MRTKPDLPLVFIAVLLLASLGAYAMKLIVYPFGIFVLGMALVGRLLYLQQKR